MLALDCAATEFFKDGKYQLAGEGKSLDAAGMAKYLEDLVRRFPIISIEDGMSEDDWARLEGADRGHRRALPARGRRSVRHQHRASLRRASSSGIANSILVKVNQIGSLSETLDAVAMAQSAGYTAVISHRSGETEDATIADIAVATNAGQIKTGSLSPLRPAREVQPTHPHRGGAGRPSRVMPARASCARALGRSLRQKT